jgi:hypothetical protein
MLTLFREPLAVVQDFALSGLRFAGRHVVWEAWDDGAHLVESFHLLLIEFYIETTEVVPDLFYRACAH